MTEQLILEAPPVAAAAKEDTAFRRLINRIETKDFTLSVTKAQNFLESPKSFIRYCLRTAPPTKAMRYGSMLHCYLLEPTVFENEYRAAPEANLSTLNGRDEYIEFLKSLCGDKFDDFLKYYAAQQEAANAAAANKKTPTDAKRVWSYKDLLAYVESNLNVEIVNHKDMQKAKYQADAIRNDRAFRFVIEPCIEYREKAVSGELSDWTWRGKIDLGGNGFKGDIKTVADASPAKLKYLMRDSLWNYQGLVYNNLYNNGDEYFIIAVDNDFETCVLKIDDVSMYHAERTHERFMTSFNKCIVRDNWGESYSFWAANRDGTYIM